VPNLNIPRSQAWPFATLGGPRDAYGDNCALIEPFGTLGIGQKSFRVGRPGAVPWERNEGTSHCRNDAGDSSPIHVTDAIGRSLPPERIIEQNTIRHDRHANFTGTPGGMDGHVSIRRTMTPGRTHGQGIGQPKPRSI
jgi:hypothetical protein